MSDNEEDILEKQLKIILLGESCVGKTSLSTRYCSDEFTKQYCPTSGVDFFLKRISLHKVKNITLHLWDVGGQSIGGSMLDKYVFGAQIIILVYDVTNDATFDCLEDWLGAVRNITKNQEKPPMIAIVSNKNDLEHIKAVKFEKQQKFASENNLSCYSVSARTGEGVTMCFHKIAAEYYGLRLTKSQLEEYQPIVKAEIVTQNDSAVKMPARNSNLSNSSVCVLQ